MAEKYVIGIDVGTQGTKTAIFSESGKCCATAFEKSKLYRPSSGEVEENPEDYIHVLTGHCCWGDNPLGSFVLGTRENVLGFNTDKINLNTKRIVNNFFE